MPWNGWSHPVLRRSCPETSPSHSRLGVVYRRFLPRLQLSWIEHRPSKPRRRPGPLGKWRTCRGGFSPLVGLGGVGLAAGRALMGTPAGTPEPRSQDACSGSDPGLFSPAPMHGRGGCSMVKLMHIIITRASPSWPAPAGLPVPHPAVAVRSRASVLLRLRPRRPQQNGKVERSHRIDQGKFWGRQTLPGLRDGHCCPSELGDQIQLCTLLSGSSGPHSGRKTCRAPTATASRPGVSCRRVLDTQPRGSILTEPNRPLCWGYVIRPLGGTAGRGLS